MSFDIRILGANSAVPNKDRFPTCQCISLHNENIIIDCGEGAQINISKYRIKRSKICTILISHLHGDHIYGLPGLLNSFNLNGRTDSLQIFGPVGLDVYIQSVFKHTYVHLNYELKIYELAHSGMSKVYSHKRFDIFAFPMKHRIPTYGYLIRESDFEKNINPEMIEKYDLNIDQIKFVKEGKSIATKEGTIIPNEELILPIKEPRSYAYCSDTIYDEDLVPFLYKVDLLYHEATYLHDLQHKAEERMHATAKQAAQIAKAAEVGKLIIGHYSSRYDDLQGLEDEARNTFYHTDIARQGDKFSIDYKSNS